MIKGFINYNDEQIPFVIEKYRMELFTESNILSNFAKEHIFMTNYVLEGVIFSDGFIKQRATILVDHSIGVTCYLCCYIIYMLPSDSGYDTIGIQSPFLDDVFRYGYEYLDLTRDGVNLSNEPRYLYEVPFDMNDREYKLKYRIGYDNRIGLLEDYERKGEALVSIYSNDIKECYDISIVLYRLSMFMTSCSDVPLKRITLYHKGFKTGWFYCPFMRDNAFSGYGVRFHNLDVMNTIPKIITNIAKDAGNEIKKSIPLGYLGTIDTMYSPSRFLEQVIAFEYLFEKLYPKKAHDSSFTLKKELEYMFNKFPEILSHYRLSANNVSLRIKNLRVSIMHGYTYYYDFKDDTDKQILVLVLDKLLKRMSLLMMGFSKKEISTICAHLT